MEAVMGACNGGGDASSGGGSSESTVVSKEEVVVEQLTHHNRHHTHHQHHHQNVNFEVSDDSELELGLGLSLGSKNHKQIPRIFTAKDFTNNSNNNNTNTNNNSNNNNGSSPSSASSCSSLGLRPPSSAKNSAPVNNHNASSGTKRAVSPTAVSQVVGWPPIRAYRMNSMANQSKSAANGENEAEFDEMKQKDVMYGSDEKKGNAKETVPKKSCLFVKVNMDGVAIGRKVDLNAHSSYESLGRMLEEMFTNRAVEQSSGEELMLMPKTTRPSKLLDGSSDFVLTYEDKDGDWMLVGDVPWGMFLGSVKRLRIMRTSEANGLAPRSEERSAKQRSRPI